MGKGPIDKMTLSTTRRVPIRLLLYIVIHILFCSDRDVLETTDLRITSCDNPSCK